MRPKELGPDAPSQCILLPADDGESAGATSTTEGVGVVGGTAEVRVPPLLAFGMCEREKSMVFEHLPLLSAEMRTRREMNAPSGQGGGDGRSSRGTGLVSLSLFDRCYISFQTMVDCLTTLTRLETLRIEYRFWIPDGSYRQPGRHPRPLTQPTHPRLHPVLATFAFVGATEYFDYIFTHIDAPQLENIKIEFNDPPIFNPSRILLLTSLKESFKAFDQAHIVAKMGGAVIFTLSSRRGTTSGKMLKLLIARRIYKSHWGFCGLIQDRVHYLSSLITPDFERKFRPDNYRPVLDVGIDQWSELFCFLSAAENLYLSEAVAESVTPALRELVGERGTEVLPALQNLYIDNLGLDRVNNVVKEAIGEFVAARELSGHSVTVQNWTCQELVSCVAKSSHRNFGTCPSQQCQVCRPLENLSLRESSPVNPVTVQNWTYRELDD